jgi:hypothetical protein
MRIVSLLPSATEILFDRGALAGAEAIATILHPDRCGRPDPQLVRRIR